MSKTVIPIREYNERVRRWAHIWIRSEYAEPTWIDGEWDPL